MPSTLDERFDEFWPDYGTSIRSKATTATELNMADMEDGKRNRVKSFLHEEIARARREALEEADKALFDGKKVRSVPEYREALKKLRIK